MSTFTTLDTLFGTSPTVIENTPVATVDQAQMSEENDDVQFARDNLRELSKSATNAIDEIRILAAETDAPRAYEVLSTMLNSAASINKQLVELHKTRTRVSSNTDTPQTVHNQQNIVFTGSPAELLANLKSLNAK